MDKMSSDSSPPPYEKLESGTNNSPQPLRAPIPAHSTAPPVQPTNPPQVVMQTVIAPQQVGPSPTRMTCPYCHVSMVTRLEHKATTKTHQIALALCIFCCCCFACVPYCINSCRNANHYCINCGAFIGTYQS